MYNRLAAIPRKWKKTLILLGDLCLVGPAFYLTTAGIEENLGGLPWPESIVFLAGCTALATLAVGVHRLRLEAIDFFAIRMIGVQASGIGFLGLVALLTMDSAFPATAPFLFAAAFFLLSLGQKFLAQRLLLRLKNKGRGRVPVAIYGAGSAGLQLARTLRASTDYLPSVIVDDDPNLQGVIIFGQRIESPGLLPQYIGSGKVRRVYMALPSAARAQRREVLDRLTELGCPVQTLPDYAELIGGTGLPDSLRAVLPEDLLGRDAVHLDGPQVSEIYAGQVVMVTGAGGSIGSELCRQLLECAPRKLVLFDQSEIALYSIDRELAPAAQLRNIGLRACLGSVTDGDHLRRIMASERVGIVVHAAAYKHVPMLEINEVEGVRNNVFGTQVVAEAARVSGVGRFILVSSDKAVRPTNVMGASKRLAEMIVQDMQRRPGTTVFSMVRFGNVLGSSGSVMPLFREQICNGGPVTLTHPDVSRYFMSIPEATRLVLLAGACAVGGEVFVLDMGPAVRIADLARRMITLSGLTVRDAANPGGDICIEITGLRPGEKLHEELLIDENGLLPTPHPKILRALDRILPQQAIERMMSALAWAVEARDETRLRQLVFAQTAYMDLLEFPEPLPQSEAREPLVYATHGFR